MYNKHFIPLESDPKIFSELLHELGGSTKLEFIDVWSVEPEYLALVPRPVFALILVLPTSESYEQERLEKESSRDKTEHFDAGVTWFKQTINNACGLYALLHAVCNNDGDGFIVKESLLSRLMKCLPAERPNFIENSVELEQAYNKAALQGSSETPNPQDEVDCHYISYVKAADGDLFELDGDLNGPTKTNGSLASGEDVLEKGIQAINERIRKEDGQSLQFSLLALVSSAGIEQ